MIKVHAEKICPGCGVIFTTKHRGQKFCVKECFYKNVTPQSKANLTNRIPPKHRPWDGGKRPDFTGSKHPMWGKKHDLETRALISNGTRNAWESGNVYGDAYFKNQCAAQKEAAKIRPNYKGGISETNSKIRGSGLSFKWKNEVFTRDGFVCQLCGCGGNMEAHHIKSFASIISEFDIDSVEKSESCHQLWDVKNGLTLCLECHDYVHSPIIAT